MLFSMDNKKQLFAFISYSRLDKPVATDIQQRLEKYVYPKNLVEPQFLPLDETYVRPVFLDLTDLSTISNDYRQELEDKVASARYLLIICSENSAKSEEVRQEIAHFLKTHDNNTDLIIPVFIDRIVENMPEAICQIVSKRNCPVYITARTNEGHVGRNYCFYHILEKLLHVEFYKLYNRYEKYKREKQRKKMSVIISFFALILSVAIYGWVAEKRVAEIEKERVKTAEALTEFERKTFPYSLVVGYVSNFLAPALNAVSSISLAKRAHVIIYMPSCYEDLDIKRHADTLDEEIMSGIRFVGFSSEEIEVPERKRGISLVRAEFEGIDFPVYIDHANTVIAFQYVVDYKCNSDKNPIKIVPTKEIKDEMVQQYTTEFIESTMDIIPEYSSYVHFVKTKEELKTVIEKIINVQQ